MKIKNLGTKLKKFMDEIKRLVDTSKASGKTVNTNKDIIDKKITKETMKAMDNDSINKKIIETKKDNKLVIIEDTKPNINKDTKPNIDIFKDFSSNNKTKAKKDMDKTIPRNKKDMDKTIPKNKAEDKTIPKNKAEDKYSNIPKSKYIYEDMKENRYVRTFIYVSMPVKKEKNSDFIKKQSVWVFWSNHVTELCEKWIRKNNKYAYTRLKRFINILVRCFILESIKQSHQNINKTL